MGRIIVWRSVAAVAAGAAISACGYFAAAGAPAAAAKLLPSPKPAARPVQPGHYATAACAAQAADSCTLAGYQATGTDFRYAQAVITIPGGPGSLALPRFYVALRGRLTEARAGVFWDSRAGVWQVFAGLWHWDTPLADQAYPFPARLAGQRVFVSMYYDRAGDTMDAVLKLPGGITYRPAFGAHHAWYAQALAVANWKGVSWGAQPAGSPVSTRLARFTHGRFTTLTGQRGTFAGPWRLTRFVLVGGYLGEHAWQVSSPGRLWADGPAGHSTPSNAFGIWLRRQVMP